jgi:ABC-type uncharacterized transport system permease subunit
MLNPFNINGTPLTSRNFYAPAENDSVDLVTQGFGVFVSGGGNLVVQNSDGVVVTINSVAPSTFIPIQIKRLMTATTATGIIIMA